MLIITYWHFHSIRIPVQLHEVIAMNILSDTFIHSNHLNLHIITIWWRKYDFAQSYTFTRLVTRFPVDVNLIEFFPSQFTNVTLSHRVIYGRTSEISGVCAQANPFSISQFLTSICICIHFRPVTTRIHQSISHSWPFSFALALSLPFYFFLSLSISPDLISYIVSSAYHTLVCGTFTAEEEDTNETRMRLRRWYKKEMAWGMGL